MLLGLILRLSNMKFKIPNSIITEVFLIWMFYTQISYMNNFESSINGLRVGNLKLVLKC